MTRIDLSFGSPEHGWLSTTLTAPQRVHQFEASDVPADSLQMLARALERWYAGAGESVVEWFLEPEWETWRILRSGDLAELRVSRASEHGASRPELLAVVGTPAELWIPMRRALVALESDAAWRQEPLDQIWSWPFPSEALAALTRVIAP